MLLQKTLPWTSPIDFARGIPKDENCWALLFSGLRTPFTGRYSLLAMNPEKELKSGNFNELKRSLSSNKKKLDNSWFGYLGYGLKNTLEALPDDKQGNINFPNLWMVKYGLILLFDHEEKRIEVWVKNKGDLSKIPTPIKQSLSTNSSIKNLNSNMSKEEYLDKVSDIKEAIVRGDLYQANLTRKFFGEFEETVDTFELFITLSEISPSPYSAFLKLEDTSIISSSPERFIYMNDNGKAESRPIKGSSPRFDNKERDEESKNNLKKSEKDKAENLMIVDLMRNDFSRSCKKGSVSVESLFDISSYSTVHHMSSTINGYKRSDVSSLDFVKNCFPPGSMTGTPKIKAIEMCSDLERLERGVYSGAIGWFGGDGSVDLSVVIRTLIVQGKFFEFQAGGAIVNDSNPTDEWNETLLKGKAIAKSLNIKQEQLEAI